MDKGMGTMPNCALLSLLLATAAMPAHAQSGTTAPGTSGTGTSGTGAPAAQTDGAQAPAGGIEDIVVTAQYRQESLREVPLSITALTGPAIEANNITDFADLARLTPGFVSAPNYGFIRNSSMRGISNNQFGFADDPSIAIFTDGVYQGRGGTGSIVNAFYDVDRVEIIKGPQATLFGRSSIGGAINTILRQPERGVTGGDAEIGIGERGRLIGRGALNLPVTPDLTLRVAGDFEHANGYLRNLSGGKKLAPQKIGAGRAILRYEGAGGLDVSLRGGIEDRRQSGSVYQAVGLPKFTVDSNLLGRAAFSNFKIGDGALRIAIPLTEGVALTSTSSYREVKNRYVEDYDALPTIVGGPYFQRSRDRLLQQDLILTVAADPVRASFGASAFSEKLDASVSNYVNETFAFTGVPDAGLKPGDYSLALFEAGDLRGKFHGWSVFGDVTVEVAPGLKLTGGARYNYDHKRYTQNIADPATLPQSPLIFPGAFYNWGYYTSRPITSQRGWRDLAFRAAATYEVTPDVNLYASFNQGWKAGGIDSFKVVTPQPFDLFFGLDAAAAGGVPNIYDPEQSDSYEAGVKGRFLDRKLQVNLSIYHYTYRDLQVSVPQGGSSVIANVGRARGNGAEAEVRLVPVTWLDLFANAAYNDTKILGFEQKPEQVGLPLNQAPKWTAAAGATATAPLGDGGGTLALSGNVSYRSRYRNDNSLFFGVKPYTLTNLRATWTTPGERVAVDLFVDNLFNIETFSRYNKATPFLFPVDSVSVIGEPRLIGGNVRMKY